VTATLAAGAAGGVGGQTIHFSILSGPNAGATSSAITDASGHATFTYIAAQGLGGLGTDTIQASFGPDSQGDSISATATKVWRDTTPPVVTCVPSVNPRAQHPARREPEPGRLLPDRRLRRRGSW
jgi:hypothetical protein